MHDVEGNLVRRVYGTTGDMGRLFVPRRAETEDGTVIGDGAVEVCRYCGSDRLSGEERDAPAFGPDGKPTPREAHGSWIMCDQCGREWPDSMEPGRFQ